MVKHMLRAAARTTAADRIVQLFERCDRGCENLLHVLTYHRIDEPGRDPHLSPTTLSATPAMFDAQLAHLARHYRVVSMSDVQAAARGDLILPSRAVLLTFDDAYRDFREQAWPILRRYNLPATLFVPTAYPDQPQRTFWWDQLHVALQHAPPQMICVGPWGSLALQTPQQRALAYREVVDWLKLEPHPVVLEQVERLTAESGAPVIPANVLSWQELRDLAGEGLTLGAHTQTHPLLNRVSAAQALAEAAGSLADLRAHVPEVAAVFAYPGGKFSSSSTAALAEAGFELAFTGRRGSNQLSAADPLLLRRNHLGMGTSLAVFRMRLLSWSRFLNPCRPIRVAL